MTEGCVFIDGEYVAPEDARMSIFDAGFVWGDTVYDVTSTWAGWFFMLDEHLARFERSCAGFRLENPYGTDEMRCILAECVARAGHDNCYVKLQLTRGVIKSQTRDPRLGAPQFVAYATPYAWIWGEEKCRNGAALHLSGIERVSSRAIDARYKNYNRADFVQARFEAYDRGCDDALLVGADGALTEGPGYNIFVVKDGAVATPDANVLEGITRRAVAELCDEQGISFACRRVEPEELEEADELFASTTAGGVMPVVRLGDRPIGNGHVGLLTGRIQSRYWQKREQGWHGTRVDDLRMGLGRQEGGADAMSDLPTMSLRQLLELHAGIMEELRRRGVARNENNPTANVAEFLFCRAFDWERMPNSEKGFSAKDRDGRRYQIKGRRLHPRSESRQLSAIRDLNGFDELAAVLLDKDYHVLRAALIPSAVVRDRCKFVRHTNSYNFMLTDDIWDDSRVTDTTQKLRTVELEV